MTHVRGRNSEVDVKNEIALILLLLAVPVSVGGCHKARRSDPVQTGTIAPATPTPSASSDSDTAMTQTVEIGDERSPNEGGILTESSTATTPARTTTAPPSKPRVKKH